MANSETLLMANRYGASILLCVTTQSLLLLCGGCAELLYFPKVTGNICCEEPRKSSFLTSTQVHFVYFCTL